MDNTTVPVCAVVPEGVNTTGISGMTLETLNLMSGFFRRLIRAEKSWSVTEKKLAWEAQPPVATAQKVTLAHVRSFVCTLHALQPS